MTVITTEAHDALKEVTLDTVAENIEDLIYDNIFLATVIDRSKQAYNDVTRDTVRGILREVVDAIESLNY
jgi:NTP pyrophosphatase (non-canonical NTP hydrolase)